jgi:hypothetical protein
MTVSGRTTAWWTRGSVGIAIAAAAIFTLALAWRPNMSTDTGYHLAYGETFLSTGRIVDGHDFIYTELDPRSLTEPGNRPPGAWYDAAHGRYRFPNANYASQIVMAGVYRAGGWFGLGLLQLALVAGTWALMLLAMRALAVPPLAIAGGALLAAVVSSERFALRPELFAAILLAAILYLVAGARGHPRRLLALPAVQWLFVQFHSFWLLGLATAGAWLLGEAIGLAGRATNGTRATDGNGTAARLRHVRRLALAFAAMIVVAFLNPWGWRLALLPVQTLAFLKAQNLSGAAGAATPHPWTQIAELRGPFEGAIAHMRSTYAYALVLAVAAAGLAGAILARRWHWLLAIAGMTLVSLSARRNIAPATIVLLPVALAATAQAWRAWRGRRAWRAARPWFPAGAALAITALALYWTSAVITSRYYFDERLPWQFGAGASTGGLPLAAAGKLRSLPPGPRVFTSFNTSSTVLFFGRPDSGVGEAPAAGQAQPATQPAADHVRSHTRAPVFREVPILTNSWAYPPSVMQENMDLCSGARDFAPFAQRYDIGYAVLDCSSQSAPLIQTLLADTTWAAIDFSGVFILFARASLAPPGARCDLDDPRALMARVEAGSAVPAFALHRLGTSLALLGREAAAEPVWRRCVALDAGYYDAWASLGAIRARRGFQCGARGDYAGAQRDLEQARQDLSRALKLRPRYAAASSTLQTVEQGLARLRQMQGTGGKR